ncbi:MAG: TIGR04283 family arsenosugar biosynthesis glycosyltransferase [Deltaproteobacteria bacterium]|nr:TIGR04283 family arsenosugar biosynthesis glycosyltransferase [Deltaproteobacteria bacterium]
MLSVIVPALNEESCLKACLEAILRGGADEIVVVDGGSDDGSTNVARRYERVRTIGAPRGRALQMNAGAAASSGEFLLFCHADTVLPDGYADAVRQTLADNRVTLGAFRFRLAENRAAYRAIEFGVALRCALLGMPYGDQAFFCRRADFDRVGGFAPPPALEDICFVRAIKRFGTVRILPLPALTSDRAWRENGALRQTLRNYARALRHALAAAPPAGGTRG